MCFVSQRLRATPSLKPIFRCQGFHSGHGVQMTVTHSRALTTYYNNGPVWKDGERDIVDLPVLSNWIQHTQFWDFKFAQQRVSYNHKCYGPKPSSTCHSPLINTKSPTVRAEETWYTLHWRPESGSMFWPLLNDRESYAFA